MVLDRIVFVTNQVIVARGFTETKPRRN